MGPLQGDLTIKALASHGDQWVRLLRSGGKREEVGHLGHSLAGYILSLEAIREALLSPCSLLYCFCLATDLGSMAPSDHGTKP